MTYEIKIRLTKPFLGALRPDVNGVRRFDHRNRQILVPREDWLDAMRKAAKLLGMHKVRTETIFPPVAIRPPTIHLYRRIFNRTQVENFESFRAGTVLTLEFIVDVEDKARPGQESLKRMLEFVGLNIGFSPFGNRFGFGRFELLSIVEK